MNANNLACGLYFKTSLPVVPAVECRNITRETSLKMLRGIELAPTVEDILATFPGLAADGEGQSILRESSRPVRLCAWHRLWDLRRHLRRRAEHLEELRPEKLRDALCRTFFGEAI